MQPSDVRAGESMAQVSMQQLRCRDEGGPERSLVILEGLSEPSPAMQLRQTPLTEPLGRKELLHTNWLKG